MKANEAPEKLYITNDEKRFGDKCHSASTEKYVDDDIEYARTDAFVDKAVSWLKENADHYVGHYLNDDDTYMDESFIEDFRKYMEEE